jgi:NADP-reducing hydrogenase subunit HndB
MNRINSLAELKALHASLKQKVTAEEKSKVVIRIPMATCSIASGSTPVLEAFSEQMPRQPTEFLIKATGCNGLCHSEPTVEVTIPGAAPVMFGRVNVPKVTEIITKFILKGEPVDGVIKEG